MFGINLLRLRIHLSLPAAACLPVSAVRESQIQLDDNGVGYINRIKKRGWNVHPRSVRFDRHSCADVMLCMCCITRLEVRRPV